ncbi:MAG: PaaI family thioesterase [Actinobacteria bacterium]|nr:PaaI family thioesterase [Actinomycetota bacterium]
MTAAELDEFLAGAFPHSEIQYRVREVTPVGITMVLASSPTHERPGGTISGPAMMSLADAAAWLATLSRIGPVALAVTSSLCIDFLRKPELGDLEARVELLKLGRRQSVSDVRLHSATATHPVARATVTYSIP